MHGPKTGLVHGVPTRLTLVGRHTPRLHAALMTQSPAAGLGVQGVPSGLTEPLQVPSTWQVSMVVHSWWSSHDCSAREELATAEQAQKLQMINEE